jgi:hypothetical protein
VCLEWLFCVSSLCRLLPVVYATFMSKFLNNLAKRLLSETRDPSLAILILY